MGLENKEARLQLAKTVAAYKRAIKYLDNCGELTVSAGRKIPIVPDEKSPTPDKG